MKTPKHLLRVLCVAGIVAAAFFLNDKSVFSQTSSDENSSAAKEINTLNILVGDLDTIVTDGLVRVAVADPSIADVLETKPSGALVVGKATGKTDIYVWDNEGKRRVTVWVTAEGLDLVQARITKLLKAAEINSLSITKNDLEAKLVISGDVEEKQKKAFDDLIAPFAASIINMVKVREKRELIEFDVQVTEINSSYTKTLGVEWNNDGSDEETMGGQYIYDETVPTGSIKKFGDIFKIGNMARVTALRAKINALITEGKAKVLSRPRIVVKSGEEASFLVGGQIPIKTSTISSGGTVTENVIFHDYGVNLKIRSFVEKEGKIDIDLNVEVSDIDATNAVGDTVAYTTRNAKTKLYLDSGQTIVLAGFIKDNKSVNTTKVPFLGSIPIVGLFFRSQLTSPDNQTELFIMMTPTVVSTNEKKSDQPEKEEKSFSKAAQAPEEQKSDVAVADEPSKISVTKESPKQNFGPYEDELGFENEEEAEAEEEPAADPEFGSEFEPQVPPQEETEAPAGADAEAETQLQEQAQEETALASVPTASAEPAAAPLTIQEIKAAERKEKKEKAEQKRKEAQEQKEKARQEEKEAREKIAQEKLAAKEKAKQEKLARQEQAKQQKLEKEKQARQEKLARQEKAKQEKAARQEKARQEKLAKQEKAKKAKEASPEAQPATISQEDQSVQADTPAPEATETANEDYPSVAMPEQIASYARGIQEQIAKNIFYPPSARESQEQGLVEINLTVLNDGALVAASVSKSSGSSALDEAALETVQKLSPYSAFPSELTFKQLTLTIPIVYQLD